MAVYGGKYMGTSYMRGRSLRSLRLLLFHFSLASRINKADRRYQSTIGSRENHAHQPVHQLQFVKVDEQAKRDVQSLI